MWVGAEAAHRLRLAGDAFSPYVVEALGLDQREGHVAVQQRFCQISGLGVQLGSDLGLPTPALRFEVGQSFAPSRAEIGVAP